MRACGKLSKLLRRTSVSSKSYLPPKSCMPSRAEMTMKRKSSSSKEAMERTELSRDATRLLSDVQCLKEAHEAPGGLGPGEQRATGLPLAEKARGACIECKPPPLPPEHSPRLLLHPCRSQR